ncbi:MAG TPA: hypothetical protein V6C78_08090 [Crinalium sp.]
MVSVFSPSAIARDTTTVQTIPPIYFYIPKRYWASVEFPQHPQEYWAWQNINPAKYQWGMYNWTLQTYLYLKADGLPCSLVQEMPSEGIVISHKDFLPDHAIPNRNTLLICIQGDKTEHPYAQLHVVQNLQDQQWKERPTLWDSYYMPHWIQSSLIPRNPERGDRFENIVYMGDAVNLAPELRDPSFSKALEEMGLRWRVVGRDGWNDYSEIDAIVAVRSFTSLSSYRVKPALKLCNAWHAGVPAILGQEPAFQAERKGDLDYLEVTSLEDVLTALQVLRDDVELRQAIVSNGRIRARATNEMQLTQRWRQFLTHLASPMYERWCNQPEWQRQIFLQRRSLVLKQARFRNRSQSFFKKFGSHQATEQCPP